ncbi:hypothetical protein [Actinophytocola xinjiangensis]|uniref:hypothetical protein n=1 Tax=Actinophytocola xinjiangensis TaxID=485602 RepID=UPI001FE5294D|nr:hypothetical protein [Actinophytocola xinjiangensis]
MFTSFTLSQAGMVRHWSRALTALDPDDGARAGPRRSRAINLTGAVLTSVVLAVVFATKVTEGAWLAIVAMALTYLAMGGVRHHYDRFDAELAATGRPARPAHVHAVVLVAGVNQPVLHALALARSFNPDSLEAVTASASQEETTALRTRWERLGLADCALRIVDAPYRTVGPPLVRYLRERPAQPRGVVVVFVPEYVVAHWWENLLHNQTALRLKAHLLRVPGVVVVDVPFHLGSREHGWLR